MTPSDFAITAALVFLGLTVVFHAVTTRINTMQIADLVTGLQGITTQLQAVPAEITAAIAAGDSTALATIDQPFADLQTAVAAISAALAPTT